MRLSERNKQDVWYANYVSNTPITDEWGNETGESKITYSTPSKSAWNMNIVESDSEVAAFGIRAVDAIVGAAEKDGFPLGETSILWYGITPEINEDGTTDVAHNYRVVGIRSSLNTIKFYARKISITNAPKTTPAEDSEI